MAKGSNRPARLVILRYSGGPPGAPPLTLVGKGVTFDSGGLSLKTPEGMLTMKCDKAGAATMVGAMQAIEQGRSSDVSCACHWTVGVAASKGKGRLYGDVYSVAPSGVFVPKDSPVQTPEDLAGVPIAVGYQSGSHYSTIQALEQYMPADKINLTFADGMLFHPVERDPEQMSPGAEQDIQRLPDPAAPRLARRDHEQHAVYP